MRLIAIFTAIIFCLALGAQAADTSVRAGAHVAITTGSDMDSGLQAYGAQAEIGVMKNLGIELAVTTGMEKKDIDLQGEYLPGAGFMDLETTTFAGSLVYRHELAEKMNAFLLGGISYNYFDADGKPTNDVASYDFIKVDADNQLGFQFGLGFGYLLFENLEIFIEYVHVFTQLEADIETPRLGGGTDKTDIDENIDYGLFKIGLNYVF